MGSNGTPWLSRCSLTRDITPHPRPLHRRAAPSAPAAGPSLAVLYELPSRQPHGVFVTFVEQVVQQQMQTTDVLVGERRKPTCLQQLGEIADHILGKLRAHGRRHWVVRLAGAGHETTCPARLVARTSC